jgi:hypothetical protein
MRLLRYAKGVTKDKEKNRTEYSLVQRSINDIYGSTPCGPWSLFQFLNLNTVGMTPWTGDQPVARLFPTQDKTNTE